MPIDQGCVTQLPGQVKRRVKTPRASSQSLAEQFAGSIVGEILYARLFCGLRFFNKNRKMTTEFPPCGVKQVFYCIDRQISRPHHGRSASAKDKVSRERFQKILTQFNATASRRLRICDQCRLALAGSVHAKLLQKLGLQCNYWSGYYGRQEVKLGLPHPGRSPLNYRR
jgi:hypothetical protein